MTINERIESLIAKAPHLWKLDACGVTRSERAIPVMLHPDTYTPATDRMRVILIGGLSGHPEDVELTFQALESYIAGDDGLIRNTMLSAVPCGNPDGLAQGVAPDNGAGGNPSAGYPPIDNFFDDPRDPEVRYLWRWASFQAPDFILEVRTGDTVCWEVSDPDSQRFSGLDVSGLPQDDSLLAELATGSPSGLAPIPGLRLICSPDALGIELNKLWAILSQPPGYNPSEARRALDARRSRSSLEVARVLASAYGYTLDPVAYTQGVAISGRLRLAQLEPEGPDPTPDIVNLVHPYVSGAREMFSDRISGANLAGLVWAAELAEATGDKKYTALIISIADRYAASEDDAVPGPSDPDYRVEDMFFSGAILGRAFRITGSQHYLDILTKFLLDANVQQDDGLFWHSRSVPYKWGRGNGFAALGFAETLTYLPDNHPDRAALLDIHEKHLSALHGCQNPTGMWLQVIDLPGSYQEMTATCMIGYTLARGMRLGWLDSTYEDSLKLAWQGVSERIDNDGGLVDVCTGTGVQENLRDYLDRPAIFGLDDRGGSMALWFAVEMERFFRE